MWMELPYQKVACSAKKNDRIRKKNENTTSKCEETKRVENRTTRATDFDTEPFPFFSAIIGFSYRKCTCLHFTRAKDLLEFLPLKLKSGQVFFYPVCLSILFCFVLRCVALLCLCFHGTVCICWHVAWAKLNRFCVGFDCTLLRHVRLLLVRRTWEPAVTHTTHTQSEREREILTFVVYHYSLSFKFHTLYKANKWMAMIESDKSAFNGTSLFRRRLLLLLQTIQT